MEAAFKRCVILFDSEGWGRDRFVTGLSQIAPFDWRVSELEGERMLVEGPIWWRERALKAGKTRIEDLDIPAEAWNSSAANGMKLKSVWIRIQGFPMKLWCKAEFEKLLDGFGVLYELDPATRDLLSFKEAKMRIGVADPGDIPVQKRIKFKTDRNEWCWGVVRFIVDTPLNTRPGGSKRRRIWIRKPGPSTSGTPKTPREQPRDEGREGDDDVSDWEGEDLLAEERGEAYEEIDMVENPTDVIPAEEKFTGTISPVPETVEAEVLKEDHGGQLVLFQPDVMLTTPRDLTVEGNPTRSVVLSGPETRYSLRQRFKDPDVPVQTKAMMRAKERDLEHQGTGKSSSLDKFPFTDLSDEEVLTMFDCFGISLSASFDESIEHVRFLRTLSKKQFFSVVEEMEFKVQYGTRFQKKDIAKKQQLDKMLCGVSASHSI